MTRVDQNQIKNNLMSMVRYELNQAKYEAQLDDSQDLDAYLSSDDLEKTIELLESRGKTVDYDSILASYESYVDKVLMAINRDNSTLTRQEINKIYDKNLRRRAKAASFDAQLSDQAQAIKNLILNNVALENKYDEDTLFPDLGDGNGGLSAHFYDGERRQDVIDCLNAYLIINEATVADLTTEDLVFSVHTSGDEESLYIGIYDQETDNIKQLEELTFVDFEYYLGEYLANTDGATEDFKNRFPGFEKMIGTYEDIRDEGYSSVYAELGQPDYGDAIDLKIEAGYHNY